MCRCHGNTNGNNRNIMIVCTKGICRQVLIDILACKQTVSYDRSTANLVLRGNNKVRSSFRFHRQCFAPNLLYSSNSQGPVCKLLIPLINISVNTRSTLDQHVNQHSIDTQWKGSQQWTDCRLRCPLHVD